MNYFQRSFLKSRREFLVVFLEIVKLFLLMHDFRKVYLYSILILMKVLRLLSGMELILFQSQYHKLNGH